MKKSLWIILILGVLTLGLLLLGLHLTLTALQKSTAGGRVKLANRVQNHFHFDSVSVTARKEGEVRYLLVAYETDKALGPGGAEEREEIRSVGSYVFEQLAPDERRETDQVRVERREVRSAGCDRQVRKAEGKVINPETERLFRDE